MDDYPLISGQSTHTRRAELRIESFRFHRPNVFLRDRRPGGKTSGAWGEVSWQGFSLSEVDTCIAMSLNPESMKSPLKDRRMTCLIGTLGCRGERSACKIVTHGHSLAPNTVLVPPRNARFGYWSCSLGDSETIHRFCPPAATALRPQRPSLYTNDNQAGSRVWRKLGSLISVDPWVTSLTGTPTVPYPGPSRGAHVVDGYAASSTRLLARSVWLVEYACLEAGHDAVDISNACDIMLVNT